MKLDLNYYVISNQWSRVTYIILCNFQNTNLQIFSTKAAAGNLMTDY